MGPSCFAWATPGTIGLADACGKPTRAERQTALGKIDDDLRKLTAAAKDWKSQASCCWVAPDTPFPSGSARFLCACSCQRPSGCHAEDRATMQFDADPARLRPGRVSRRPRHVPGKARGPDAQVRRESPQGYLQRRATLHYRPEGGGYLLYSVGPNGKDDGGKGREDCKEGEGWDDLAVHVPAAAK